MAVSNDVEPAADERDTDTDEAVAAAFRELIDRWARPTLVTYVVAELLRVLKILIVVAGAVVIVIVLVGGAVAIWGENPWLELVRLCINLCMFLVGPAFLVRYLARRLSKVKKRYDRAMKTIGELKKQRAVDEASDVGKRRE